MLVRVMMLKENEGAFFVRDEEFATRREAVSRVKALGRPGNKFFERGRTVRVVYLVR